jgi:sugar-phosphatase
VIDQRTHALNHFPDRLFERCYDGFLFDMDGTLLNSIAAAERVWSRWALRHGLDLDTFLPTMHGKRGIDTISALNLPGIDVVKEASDIERGEIEDLDGIVPIPGAIAFLNSLPAERWAIVTSAPSALARARIGAAGLPQPLQIVTAEDVMIGKPDPAGYRLGAQRIGLDPSRCLVFEDVLAGVRAGEAAGADVAVVTATHAHPFETEHPTIASYAGLRVDFDPPQGLRIVPAS